MIDATAAIASLHSLGITPDGVLAVSVTLLLAALGAMFTVYRQGVRNETRQEAFEQHCEQRFDAIDNQIGRLADYIHSMAGKL